MRNLPERTNRVNGGLLDFPRSVDDLFQRFWNGAIAPLAGASWQPAVDVIETPQSYVIRLEIPGIDPNAVEVTLSGDALTVRGEKQLEERFQDQNMRVEERASGRFERSFTFPTPVAADEIRAEARLGVLTIAVMKSKEAQPRKIQVRQA